MEFYKSEDIIIPDLEYSDNQDVLDLIVKKTGSIIALLDEEGVVPNGSSEGFLNKITKTFANNKRFIAKTRTRDFGIKHYAGEVTYDPTFFLSKNKVSIAFK
jgi:myosin heavy subunit